MAKLNSYAAHRVNKQSCSLMKNQPDISGTLFFQIRFIPSCLSLEYRCTQVTGGGQLNKVTAFGSECC